MKVLVTGASAGIGAALARMLAGQGHTVGIVARRADRLQQVLADCHAAGSTASRSWVADLADLERAEDVVREAWHALGHLDVLVNNAGIPMRRPTTKLTPGEIEHTMRVNFFSPARMALAVLPLMLERDGGVIVNVSSVAGRLGNPNEAAYCASKFALCGWSEATAADLWGTGVTVRLVNPGPIDTDIWDLPGNDAPLYDGPKTPPEEVAGGIIAAIEGDTFEHYLPDLKPIVDGKNADIDAFLAGVSQFAAQAKRST